MIVWTALVLMFMPDGQIIVTHNAHTFRTYQDCASHVNRSTAKLDIPHMGFCFDSIWGEDV